MEAVLNPEGQEKSWKSKIQKSNIFDISYRDEEEKKGKES